MSSVLLAPGRRAAARAAAVLPAGGARRSFVPSVARRGGGGHDAGPPMQPFKRTRMPEGPLHEEHELVWDDRVAAEMCLDFDASFVSKGEALRWWFGGLGFFFGLLGLVSLTSPGSLNPVVNKAETMPDLGLSFIKTGGSPAAEEEAEEEAEE